MINNETHPRAHANPNNLIPQPQPSQQQSHTSMSKLMLVLCAVCNKLNNCLPEQEQIQISASIQSITYGIADIVEKVIEQIGSYEKVLQGLEQNLRKHIKNQIQLKLYYEHLEDVITGLKKDKNQDAETIKNLRIQLSGLREKEKYYMTISNNNTKYNQETGQTQSKLDTITKIKNRLSLTGTGEFYNNYLIKKIDREKETLQLRDKRQSLANALKQLYDSPVQSKSNRSKSNKSKKNQNNRRKSKDKTSKSKSKEKQHSKSHKDLKKTSSRKSLKSPSQTLNSCKNSDIKINTSKNVYKITGNGITSRRNSKP